MTNERASEASSSGSSEVPLISVEELRTRLGLASGKCENPTSNDTPCKYKIARGLTLDEADISARLEKLTQFRLKKAEEVLVELQALAKVVHCSYHYYDNYCRARAEAWVKLLFEQDLPSPSALIAQKIKAHLWPTTLSKNCLGDDSSGKRCKRKVGGRKILVAQYTTVELLRPSNYLNKNIRNYAANVLGWTRFCDDPSHDPGNQVQFIISDLETIIGDASVKASTKVPPPAEDSIMVQGYKNQSEPAECWPEAFDMSPFVTEIKPNRPLRACDARAKINDLLYGRSSSRKSVQGWIYVYQVTGNDTLVKIGYTTKDAVQDRVTEWEYDCNRQTTLLYPLELPASGMVPNANLVESLCHAELDFCNESMFCKGCLINHKEWFRVSPDNAIAVIEKWIAWARQRYPITEKAKPKQVGLAESDIVGSMAALSISQKATQVPEEAKRTRKPIETRSGSPGPRPRRVFVKAASINT